MSNRKVYNLGYLIIANETLEIIFQFSAIQSDWIKLIKFHKYNVKVEFDQILSPRAHMPN